MHGIMTEKDAKAMIYGTIIGDALGLPVEFWSREEIEANPVEGMRGYGTFNLPPGSWSDDSSLTLATMFGYLKAHQYLEPKNEEQQYYRHIMKHFRRWLVAGKFTPYHEAFDVGITTLKAILHYACGIEPLQCGLTDEKSNGNGSLMRIAPVVLYCLKQKLDDDKAIEIIHNMSRLTHGHPRVLMACGMYYFIAKAASKRIYRQVHRREYLDVGLRDAKEYYEKLPEFKYEVEVTYKKFWSPMTIAFIPYEKILSGGYVVETMEGVIWTLYNTDNFKDAVLTAVNLGHDTDTVGAITGSLAGFFYGYDSIPEEWINSLAQIDRIERLVRIYNGYITTGKDRKRLEWYKNHGYDD